MSLDPKAIRERIAHLEKQISELRAAQSDPALEVLLGDLAAEVEALRRQSADSSPAWGRVQLARHPQRPHTLDYVSRLFTNFPAIPGDRRFADDPAIVCGMARFGAREVMVVGQRKGATPNRSSIAISACRSRRAIARPCGPCKWRRGSRGRFSVFSTPR